MKGSYGKYPSLGRYFKTLQELADAACMSRFNLRLCLDGKREFRKAEKIAILNYITVRNKYGIPEVDLFDLMFGISDVDWIELLYETKQEEVT